MPFKFKSDAEKAAERRAKREKREKRAKLAAQYNSLNYNAMLGKAQLERMKKTSNKNKDEALRQGNLNDLNSLAQAQAKTQTQAQAQAQAKPFPSSKKQETTDKKKDETKNGRFGAFTDIINKISNYGGTFTNYLKTWADRTTSSYGNKPGEKPSEKKEGFGGFIGMILTGLAKAFEFIVGFVQTLVTGKMPAQNTNTNTNINKSASSSSQSTHPASGSTTPSFSGSMPQFPIKPDLLNNLVSALGNNVPLLFSDPSKLAQGISQFASMLGASMPSAKNLNVESSHNPDTSGLGLDAGSKPDPTKKKPE